jgi:hypothetical protein
MSTAEEPLLRFEEGDAFADVTDDVDELLADPALAPAVARISEQMAEADRVHAMTLAMIRRAAGLTQTAIAENLNVSQTAVARTEKRGDMLLSTLRSYLEAVGARATILVELPDGRIAEVSLQEAAS